MNAVRKKIELVGAHNIWLTFASKVEKIEAKPLKKLTGRKKFNIISANYDEFQKKKKKRRHYGKFLSSFRCQSFTYVNLSLHEQTWKSFLLVFEDSMWWVYA